MEKKGLVEKVYIKPDKEAADYADDPNHKEWKSSPPKGHGEWRWVGPDLLVRSFTLTTLRFFADVQKA